VDELFLEILAAGREKDCGLFLQKAAEHCAVKISAAEFS
jgi:hypothetical protein